MNRRGHVRPLDGLRALAILLVIAHNTNIFPDHPGGLWPLATLATAGWTGVQLFFVLSGFLITGRLIDAAADPHRLRDFYLRRVLRIFPLYYLALLVGLVLLPLLAGWPPATHAQRIGAASLWTFTNNWAQAYGYEVDGYSHFWSLAVEEQFYLVWPFVAWRWQGSALLRACALIVAAAFAFRLALYFGGGPVLGTYLFSASRMDALAMGAAVAVLWRRAGVRTWIVAHGRTLAWTIALLLGAGAALSHGYARASFANISWGYPLLAACFALLLLLLASRQAEGQSGWLDALLGSHVAVSIGRVSYGMYVLHLPIVLYAARWFGDGGRFGSVAGALLYPACVAIAAYLAALASHALIERPFLRLKDRLAPGPA